MFTDFSSSHIRFVFTHGSQVVVVGIKVYSEVLILEVDVTRARALPTEHACNMVMPKYETNRYLFKIWG